MASCIQDVFDLADVLKEARLKEHELDDVDFGGDDEFIETPEQEAARVTRREAHKAWCEALDASFASEMERNRELLASLVLGPAPLETFFGHTLYERRPFLGVWTPIGRMPGTMVECVVVERDGHRGVLASVKSSNAPPDQKVWLPGNSKAETEAFKADAIGFAQRAS